MFIEKKTKYKIQKNFSAIELIEIKEGTNSFENFIIFKNNSLIDIYDRRCDHAGGKILSTKNHHTCPYHNWRFSPETGRYNNGLKKKKLKFKIINQKLIIENKKFIPQLNFIKSKKSVSIEYINHAFLIIEGDGFKFATDPWALGPAFGLGWWLKNKTKENWLKELQTCDFIYISHNHPDHLHQLSLSLLNKDKQIVVPNFKSDSVSKFLESMNFKNIKKIDFLKHFNFRKTDLNFMILKSGDFRDDSGLYFTAGNTSFLLAVDSNNLNSHNLPNTDLYAASFAGGASGFPLIFDNYSEKEKIKILSKNKLLFKTLRLKEIHLTNTKYFLPYAGSFLEKLDRNLYIRKNNQKNSVEDYIGLKNKFITLDINKNNIFEFFDGKLLSQKNIKYSVLNDLDEKKYEANFKNIYTKITKKSLNNYFLKSKFQDNLILFISIMNVNYTKSFFNLSINFTKPTIEVKFYKTKISKTTLKKQYKKNGPNFLFISVRLESFINILKNLDSWENLVIGFECKIFRLPNAYNAKFWHHFSNVYVKNKLQKKGIDCYSCERLNQKIFNEILNI